MKTIKKYYNIVFILLILFAGCGKGGTETGTTDSLDVTTVAAKIENISSALVPDMQSSASSSLVSMKAIDYGSSESWSVYLEDSNLTILTDIFGPNEDMAPITRIRVLVNQFRSDIESILREDPSIDCSNTGSQTLNEGDTIEIAFYGDISNGTALDRHFDCISETDQTSGTMSGQRTTIYGLDTSEVMRIALMQDTYSPNSTDTDERGSTTRNKAVTFATYSEADEDGQSVGYLDLQYSQMTWYCGADETFGTSDDVRFKSRSRITGSANLDASGEASIGLGDFTVTKYDKDLNIEGDEWLEITTKSIGRGRFSNETYSIFNVDSDSSTVADEAGIYCIQSRSDSMPSYAESENCTSYEDAVPWTGSTFPFTLSPAIEESFESKQFFEGNNTDLISDDAGNFTIPDYQTAL